MPVEMELSRVIVIEMQEQQIIVLKEVSGERSFPIVIGSREADAINRRLRGEPVYRPLTHELVESSIAALGGTLESIEINDLQEHTFYARLHVRQGDKLVTIDSRPSDAIALSAGANLKIFVAEHVLNEAGV